MRGGKNIGHGNETGMSFIFSRIGSAGHAPIPDRSESCGCIEWKKRTQTNPLRLSLLQSCRYIFFRQNEPNAVKRLCFSKLA